jgi:hypothetical protein
MTFDKINRRTHLYLAIALTPWFLLYAVSSVVLNHGSIVRRQGAPEWNRLFEREYRLPAITEDSDQWELGEKMLVDLGMLGRYRAYFEDDDKLIVTRQKFWSAIRFTYDPQRGHVLAEQRRLRWNEFLTQAHFRAGYAYPYFADVLWALMIDLLVLSTLIWIASGLYLWIKLHRFRWWARLLSAVAWPAF